MMMSIRKWKAEYYREKLGEPETADRGEYY